MVLDPPRPKLEAFRREVRLIQLPKLTPRSSLKPDSSKVNIRDEAFCVVSRSGSLAEAKKYLPASYLEQWKAERTVFASTQACHIIPLALATHEEPNVSGARYLGRPSRALTSYFPSQFWAPFLCLAGADNLIKYKGARINDVQNGMVLSSDWHTLVRFLSISFEPTEVSFSCLRVCFHSSRPPLCPTDRASLQNCLLGCSR